MCKRINLEQKLNPGCLYIGPLPMNTGPIAINDKVSIEIAPDIEFHLIVDEISGTDIKGVLVAIGRYPRTEWETWRVGDKVVVDDAFVHSVTRG